jgi:Concanavalin A-like lectin/glucanases superfamily
VAVRFSASGQNYTSATAFPVMPFTLTFWAYMVTDRNALTGLWGINGAFTPNGLITVADGTTLHLYSGTVYDITNLAFTTGTWYKIAIVASGGTVTIYYAAIGSALATATGSFSNQSTNASYNIGCSDTTSQFFNGRIASWKEWPVALSAAEVAAEFQCYMPRRTGLSRWYPFLTAGTTDLSGNGRNLSGGTGATTEDGPPIPWRLGGGTQLLIPWDPATAVWYVIYDTATGAAFSEDYTLNLPLAAGLAYKEYLNGRPNQDVFVWDPGSLSYVFRDALVTVDRVADLVADGTLTTAWAALSGAQSTAMQNRIGQMLGPYRYRSTVADIDLQPGWGTQ